MLLLNSQQEPHCVSGGGGCHCLKTTPTADAVGLLAKQPHDKALLAKIN